MAYKILNTDGTTLLLLADGTVDNVATSLTLIGRNKDLYGEDLNNNLVKLLANFASTTGRPPRSPLKGQLWYDTSARRLKVYDNGFKTVGSVTVSASVPNTLVTGDLWFDSSVNQMKLYSGGLFFTIGPAYTSVTGQNGWIIPTTAIKDDTSSAKNVSVLKSYGSVQALSYVGTEFSMSSADAVTYLPGASSNLVVNGVTLLGDLNVTGRTSNSYLSLSISVDSLMNSSGTEANDFNTGYTGGSNLQNLQIEKLLTAMYPPVATTTTNTTTVMTGVFTGTQARVLCEYSKLNGVTTSGYQVRAFKVNASSQWKAWYMNLSGTTATNVIPVV